MERLEEMSEPEQQALLKILVRRIKEALTDMGFEVPQFALLLFNDHKEGRYIVNCSRSDLIQALHGAADWVEHRERRQWRKRKSLAGPWGSGHHKGPPRGRTGRSPRRE